MIDLTRFLANSNTRAPDRREVIKSLARGWQFRGGKDFVLFELKLYRIFALAEFSSNSNEAQKIEPLLIAAGW